MEKNIKVALAFIAKDKADILERMLNSTKCVFDYYCMQDTGSSDDTIQVFENWCKKNDKQYFIGKGELASGNIPNTYAFVEVDGARVLGDFASARNDSFKLIPEDAKYAFWMDTDDVIIYPEQIPQIVDICEKNQIDNVIFEYVYARSPDGLKPVTQQRERLLNLRKKGSWKNRVHENYQFQEQVKTVLSSQLGISLFVQHERSAFEAVGTNRRNHLIMEAQINEEGIDNFSDEMLHHFSYDLWEHKEYDEALKNYQLLLDRLEGKQIHAEFVYNIYIKMGQAYFNQAKYDEAIKYAFRAITLVPGIGDGYILMTQIYSAVGNWEEAEKYADKIIALGKPTTTAPINEYEYFVIPLQVKLQAALMRQDFANAKNTMGKLMGLLQGNSGIKQDFNNILKEERKQNVIKAIGEIAQYYQENNMGSKVDKILDIIPLTLKDNDLLRSKIKELVFDRDRKTLSYKFPADYQKTIVVYAGQGYEQWDGDSDIKTGIGGSEGMCIQLMRELATLNNKVVVFNDCGSSDGKIFDGVQYIDYRKWNPNMQCDIFISLRIPQLFSALIKAKKQYLWLHDTDYGQVSLIDMYAPNKVIVLSDCHKDIIKLNHGITDDSQFWISRNAVNKKAVEYVENLKDIKRNPFQLIYASSYDRGLDTLLESIWPKIKEAVPEATLKIFYGWTTFDKMVTMLEQQGQVQRVQQMKMYKSKIIDLIAKSDGVKELGRIPQNELYKQFAESAIWIYPTDFSEISCITAMQAEVMGAIPVCTPIAALNETVNGKFGVKAEKDKIAESAIYLLKHPEDVEKRRESMMKWAKEKFDVRTLAVEWNTFFNND